MLQSNRQAKWVKSESCSVISNSWDSKTSMEFSRPGYWSCSLLQQIFPTQESNPGLTHCRQILCQLSHKGFFINAATLGLSLSSHYNIWLKNLGNVKDTIKLKEKVSFLPVAYGLLAFYHPLIYLLLYSTD